MSPRKKKGDGLGVQKRRDIYQYIVDNPGVSFSDIIAELSLGTGLLQYHIRFLLKNDFILKDSDGYFTRFYPTRTIAGEDRKLLSYLRQEFPRHIIIFILNNPKCSQKNLCEEFDLKPSTISYYIKRLDEVIEKTTDGREITLSIKDPNRVVKLLLEYRESFVDDMVNRFADVWMRL